MSGLPVTFQFRRDTAANWSTANPVLMAGELGLETDRPCLKFGDGVTPWNQLPEFWMYRFVDGEIPTGAIDGVNKTFALQHAPSQGTNLILANDGLVGTIGAGNDFTLSGPNLALATAPKTSLVAWYRY